MIMARKLRTWFPGAFYHLMHRGVRRVAIFEDEMDYQMMLELLKVSLKRYNCSLHAYCLMTNHIHLLLETNDIEIGKMMRYFSFCYAGYVNQKYHYHGHVFEGRYKSCLVKDDSYFLQTSRYIHLNPVKAGIVKYPEEYRWSSYQTMVGLSDDKITMVSKTLAYFKNNSVMRYQEFVADAGHKYVMQEQKTGRMIGDDEGFYMLGETITQDNRDIKMGAKKLP